MTESKWAQPQEIPAPQMAFPAQVTGTLLPPIEEVPEEFKSYGSGRNKWNQFISDMFFKGWDGMNPSLIVKDGVDPQLAFQQIQTVLRSYEPKHEHKEAGAAYLLSLWFSDIVDRSEVLDAPEEPK